MSDQLEIRELELLELGSAVPLYCRVFAGPPWLEIWDETAARARLEQVLKTPGALGLGIWEGAELQGFALGYVEPWRDGAHYYLKEICVSTERQRQGLGRRLMEALTASLLTQEVSKIYLLTARGEDAEAFYERLGYYTSPRMILMGRYIR